MRLLPLAAMLALVGTSGPASATPVPDWLLGEWQVKHVYQDDSKDYAPEGGPAVWWQGKSMHVAADRISFADWTCQGPHVTAGRATIDQILAKQANEDAANLGVPNGKRSVSYLEIQCDHSLIWSQPSEGRPGQQQDLGINMKWRIVTASRTRIQMPFQAWSYVVFEREIKPST